MSINKKRFVIIMTVFIAILFSSGYIFTLNKMKNQKDIEKIKANAEVANTAYKNVIKSNTVLVKRDTYTKGVGYTKEFTESPGTEIVGMDKTQAEEYFKSKQYRVIEFMSDKVVAVRDIDSWCPECFVVKGSDGYINIYSVNNNGELVFKEKTDVNLDMLPKQDREEVLMGKTYDSIDRVEELIEEYCS